MPMDTVHLLVDISVHSDSLPLNGEALAVYLKDAIEAYRVDNHKPHETIELDMVLDDASGDLFFGDPT